MGGGAEMSHHSAPHHTAPHHRSTGWAPAHTAAERHAFSSAGGGDAHAARHLSSWQDSHPESVEPAKPNGFFELKCFEIIHQKTLEREDDNLHYSFEAHIDGVLAGPQVWRPASPVSAGGSEARAKGGSAVSIFVSCFLLAVVVFGEGEHCSHFAPAPQCCIGEPPHQEVEPCSIYFEPGKEVRITGAPPPVPRCLAGPFVLELWRKAEPPCWCAVWGTAISAESSSDDDDTRHEYHPTKGVVHKQPSLRQCMGQVSMKALPMGVHTILPLYGEATLAIDETVNLLTLSPHRN